MLMHLLLFYFAVTMARTIESNNPVDCRASPVSTAMPPYEGLKPEVSSLVTRDHRYSTKARTI